MEKVVFFGTSKFVLPIIEVLKNNFDLTLVVTTEKNNFEPVISYCMEHKIKYIPTDSPSDPNLKSSILNHQSSIAVLAYFGLILKKDVLSLFPKGILNTHPSLLPKYRGPTPIQTAILNGDTKTGVTLIKLDEKVDHGPILAQKKEEILKIDTSITLYDRLFRVGAKLLEENMQKYLDGKLELKEQDHKNSTYTQPFKRENGYFDIVNPPSPTQLDRMIRAYYPWPGTWTRLKIKDLGLKIIKFLPENKIQVEGKKPVSLITFVQGYPQTQEIIEKLFDLHL